MSTTLTAESGSPSDWSNLGWGYWESGQSTASEANAPFTTQHSTAVTEPDNSSSPISVVTEHTTAATTANFDPTDSTSGTTAPTALEQDNQNKTPTDPNADNPLAGNEGLTDNDPFYKRTAPPFLPVTFHNQSGPTRNNSSNSVTTPSTSVSSGTTATSGGNTSVSANATSSSPQTSTTTRADTTSTSSPATTTNTGNTTSPASTTYTNGGTSPESTTYTNGGTETITTNGNTKTDTTADTTTTDGNGNVIGKNGSGAKGGGKSGGGGGGGGNNAANKAAKQQAAANKRAANRAANVGTKLVRTTNGAVKRVAVNSAGQTIRTVANRLAGGNLAGIVSPNRPGTIASRNTVPANVSKINTAGNRIGHAPVSGNGSVQGLLNGLLGTKPKKIDKKGHVTNPIASSVPPIALIGAAGLALFLIIKH